MVRSVARWLLAAAGSVLLGLTLVGFALYVHFLRSGPAPEPWHRVELPDFTAKLAPTIQTLDDYRALEDRLFAELRARVYAREPGGDEQLFNRYSPGSLSDPSAWTVDWNRTFRLRPDPGAASRGAVLLLHGLTDSPYSLRSIGEHLAARGYEVVGLRLPGHGTAPSGLLSFHVEDMQAAMRIAIRDLERGGPPGRPLFLIGYSNGGALALDYALDVAAGEPMPEPAALVLLSPALAVSPLAAVGRIKTGLSSLPGFERAAWEAIGPEFDPYKYTSFSLHAAGETLRLTRRVARGLEHLAAGSPQDFPPVLVFLSTVDATVKAEAVIGTLLDRLAPARGELVLFDVNRHSAVGSLLVNDPGTLTRDLLSKPERRYALTVVTNAAPDTMQVVEQRVPAGGQRLEIRPLDLAWPPTVFSLSHVALPFPPDDPLYGYWAPPSTRPVQLGRIEVHGENGVLTVPAWLLTRQRSNPFHGYLVGRIEAFLDEAAAR